MSIEGIVLIVAGFITLISSSFSKLLTSSYKTKWMVNLFGLRATQIIIGIIGIIFIVIGFIIR